MTRCRQLWKSCRKQTRPETLNLQPVAVLRLFQRLTGAAPNEAAKVMGRWLSRWTTHRVREAVRHVLDGERAGRQPADDSAAAAGAPGGIAARRNQHRRRLRRLHNVLRRGLPAVAMLLRLLPSTKTQCPVGTSAATSTPGQPYIAQEVRITFDLALPTNVLMLVPATAGAGHW